MSCLFGGKPCLSPEAEAENALRNGFPLDPWYGRANGFRCPTGQRAGRGYVLLARSDLDSLGLDTPRNLVFSGDQNSTSLTLKSLYPVRAGVVCPGQRADTDGACWVELADKRRLCRATPIDAAYNVRKGLDAATYYSATLNTGVAYTWTQMVSAIWTAVGTSLLGTYPGLPFTPDGTPEGFSFYGWYAYDALGHVLERIGCALKLDPITDTFSIVREAATDTAASLALTSADPSRIWDAEPQVPTRGRLPQYVRVLAPKHRATIDATGGSPWYPTDVPDSSTPATVQTGTYAIVHDDLPAQYDSSGSLTNAAALATRAAERGADWFRRAKQTRQNRTYTGLLTDAGLRPGAQIDGTAWEETGRGEGLEAGFRTSIISTDGSVDPRTGAILPGGSVAVWEAENAPSLDLFRVVEWASYHADYFPLRVRKNSTGTVCQRPRLNLIEGDGVTLTVADDSTDNEVDVTVAASGTSTSVITQTVEDSATSTVTNTYISIHNSTGTPAAGFGIGYLFELEDSTTPAQAAGRLYWYWIDATHATRKSASSWSVYNVSTEVPLLSIGVASGPVYYVVVGGGDGGTPLATTLRGPAGAGADVAGGALTIDASNGTGTGGSGTIFIRTAPKGSTSSTPNTLTTQVGYPAVGGYYVPPSTASISSSQNNYTPLGTAEWELSVSGSRDFTGVSNTGVQNGQIYRVAQVGSGTLTLKHNSGSSSTGNKLFVPGAADQAVTQNQAFYLLYKTSLDSGSGGWLVVFLGASSSSGTVTSVDTDAANDGVTATWTNTTTTPRLTIGLADITPDSIATGLGTFKLTDAQTANPSAPLIISHNSSGTPANGFGTIFTIMAHTSTTVDTLIARQTATWVDATHATRKGREVFDVYDTTNREALRLEASGTAAMIGFLGASASARLSSPDLGTLATTFGLASGTPTFAGANVTGTVPAATTAGTCSGNAATATALATARNIGGVAFDGTAAIVPQTIESANEATDTTCFLLFITASGTQQLQPKNNTSLTYNSNTGALSIGTSNIFTCGSIELGAASDTTLTRTGAGDIAIEGNAVYRAGGTDVAVADGGTGGSTASDARTNLGLGTAAVKNTGTSGNTVPLLDGTNTWSGAQSETITDGATTSKTTFSTFTHKSSGTPAGGFGTNWAINLEDSTNSNIQAHLTEVFWATATHGSAKARITYSVNDSASGREYLRGEASGTAAMIGFLGASASAQLASPDAGTALVTFGLASGTPTFAAANITGTISLTTQVTGTLPLGNGGTGQTTAAAAFDALTVAGADVASNGTTNIGAATGYYINVTGTTTITAFDSVTAGRLRMVKFGGALTLTHNATSLILPGTANITTAAGDTAIFESLGSGNWRCLAYQRAAAPPVSGTNTGDNAGVTSVATAGLATGGTFTTTGTVTVTAAVQSDMETGTSTTTAVTPGVMKHFRGVGKAEAHIDMTGTASLTASDGDVASVTDNGTGDVSINFTTGQSGSTYYAVGTCGVALTAGLLQHSNSGTAFATTAYRFRTRVANTATLTDDTHATVIIMGDFA